MKTKKTPPKPPNIKKKKKWSRVGKEAAAANLTL